MTHAVYSPSSAHRWMRCPAAPAMEKLFPEETTVYAKEGTLAHAWGAFFLDPENQKEPEEKLSEDLSVYVTRYADYVNAETDGGIRFIEYPVDVSPITGEQDAKGTIDCAALVGNTLKIIDLKFGAGVPVEAEGNEQLMIYAAAALPYFEVFDDIKEVKLSIFQPRVRDFASETVMTPEELEAFSAKVRQIAGESMTLLGPEPIPMKFFRPTEKGCRFCKASGCCPARRELALNAVGIETVRKEEIKPEEVQSPEELARDLEVLDQVEAWASAVRKHAFAVMSKGEKVPGWKLVEGRPGPRKWADETEAESALKSMKVREDDRYSKKLISPTQLEKLHKDKNVLSERQWKKIEGMIVRSDPSPVIAREDDKRKEFSFVATAEDFSDIEGV